MVSVVLHCMNASVIYLVQCRYIYFFLDIFTLNQRALTTGIYTEYRVDNVEHSQQQDYLDLQ